MKLKTRLTISFCIIIFVPILLAVFVIWGFQKFQIKAIETTYGIESGTYTYLTNPVQLLNQYTKRNYERLLKEASGNPDRFLEKAFLDKINRELKGKYSYLIVRKEDIIIYKGMNSDLEEKDLPGYGEGAQEEEDAVSGVYVDGDEEILIKQIN